MMRSKASDGTKRQFVTNGIVRRFNYDKVFMRTEEYVKASLNYLLDTITEATSTLVRAPRTPITIHRVYSSNSAATGILA